MMAMSSAFHRGNGIERSDSVSTMVGLSSRTFLLLIYHCYFSLVKLGKKRS